MQGAGNDLERLERAIAASPDAATLFYKLSEAHWRAGDAEGCAAYFRRAYLLRPESSITLAYGDRYMALSEAQDLRDRAAALVRHGATFSTVLAALAVGEGQLGNGDAVRRLVDHGRFLHCGRALPPNEADKFLAALAAEIRADLRYYDTPHDRAIRHGWRFERVGAAQSPAIRHLLQLLEAEVAHYIGRLPHDPAHPFIATRPLSYAIGGWAVVSNSETFHHPHIHPRAWATGVYYVVQPKVSLEPGSRKGWLKVGPPSGVAGLDPADWQTTFVEPAPGSFVLMPGYFWHETEPMGVDQERICIAFEIVPQELAGGDWQTDGY